MLRNDLYRPWFNNGEEWGFEILSGDYSGVVVQLEELKPEHIIPSKYPGQKAGLQCGYHIIHKPEHLEKSFNSAETFIAEMDLIINDILKEAIEDFRNEQDWNSNSKKLNSQWRVS